MPWDNHKVVKEVLLCGQIWSVIEGAGRIYWLEEKVDVSDLNRLRPL